MHPARILRNQRGVTLMAVLVMVVVTGLLAGMAGATWRTTMQQEREAELLWRGDQYRKAIQSYCKVQFGGIQSYPKSFEDLLRDPRSLQPVRHLRRLYADPFTGGDWVLIKEPTGGIQGVRSSSTLEPFKKDGFPEEYDKFKGKMHYSEWEFAYTQPPNVVPGSAATLRSGFPSNQ